MENAEEKLVTQDVLHFNGIAEHRKAGNIPRTPKSPDLAGARDRLQSNLALLTFKTKPASFETSPVFCLTLEELRHPGKQFQDNLSSELFFQSCQKGGIHKSLRAPQHLAPAQGFQAGCQGARKSGLPRSQQANWL